MPTYKSLHCMHGISSGLPIASTSSGILMKSGFLQSCALDAAISYRILGMGKCLVALAEAHGKSDGTVVAMPQNMYAIPDLPIQRAYATAHPMTTPSRRPAVAKQKLFA